MYVKPYALKISRTCSAGTGVNPSARLLYSALRLKRRLITPPLERFHSPEQRFPSDANDEAALAAKRAEIAARVAAARVQQEQQPQLSSGTSGKKTLSRQEVKAALEKELLGGSSSSSGLVGKKAPSALSKKDKAKAALEEHKMPTPEQLRRQAREMSRNPELVRPTSPRRKKCLAVCKPRKPRPPVISRDIYCVVMSTCTGRGRLLDTSTVSDEKGRRRGRLV